MPELIPRIPLRRGETPQVAVGAPYDGSPPWLDSRRDGIFLQEPLMTVPTIERNLGAYI